MSKQTTAGAVIRKALLPSTGLVVLVLVAVMLYYVATHFREWLPELKRPALEAVARAIGVPEDLIHSVSDEVLRELIAGWFKEKFGAAAVLAVAAAVLLTVWKLRGLVSLAAAGGVGGVAAGAVFLAVTLAGVLAVHKVADMTGVYPWGGGGSGGGGVVPGLDGTGCSWDGKQLVCNGVPVAWNTGGSVYV